MPRRLPLKKGRSRSSESIWAHEWQWVEVLRRKNQRMYAAHAKWVEWFYFGPPRPGEKMMSEITTDPDDARLHQISVETGQQEAYLVLSEEERARGFVRPLRLTYRHVTCGTTTSMTQAIAETYARDPQFYTGTFCVHCGMHFPLRLSTGGPAFTWVPDDLPVGS